MVAEQDLKPIVDQLLDAFPTFDQWFSGLDSRQRDGMRKAWIRQVRNLDPSDIQRAANEIISGRVPMPANYAFDRLGVELRTWGNVAAARRLEECNRVKLRDQAVRPADPSTKGINLRFGPAIKCAMAWGAALREGAVTEDENDSAMEIIHRFHRQGDVEIVWPPKPMKMQTDVRSTLCKL